MSSPTQVTSAPPIPGQAIASHGGTGGAPTDEYVSAYFASREDVRFRQLPKNKRPTLRHADVAPSERYAIAEHLSEALKYSQAMEEAAGKRDEMDLATNGVLLMGELSSLWNLRHLRDADWASVVNFLQAMTTHVEFESFTHDQCNAIRMVIQSHLRPDNDYTDVRAAIVLLDKSGLNPWRAISE